MAKIVLDNITSGYNLSKINDNFGKIAQELQDKVLYRDNPEGEPNQFVNDVDLNSNDLLNVNALQVQTFTVGGAPLDIDTVKIVSGIAADVSTVAAVSTDVTATAALSTEITHIYNNFSVIEDAAVAKDDSEAAALAASISETNAAASALAASTSESNAATSETNAGISASAALTSETNAGTSAAAALVSEGNAALSETAAGVSETNAEGSAIAAAASAVTAEEWATASEGFALSSVQSEYVDGTLTLTPATDADITLTTEQALFGRIVLNTGAWTIARSIIVPDAEKLRVVKVAGTYAATVKTAAGTGVPVGSGQEATLYCDGTNVDYQTKREFNAAGAAPVFACRAWVQFSDGAPPTINGSGNVSSVTKPGTGRYVVNFTTAMVDADYGIGGIAGTTPTSIALDGAPTTTSLPIKTLTTSLANAQYASIAVFR